MLLKVIMALAPIELEVHAGLALLELPTGMMSPEVLAELRGGVSGLSDAKGLCVTLPPVRWRWRRQLREGGWWGEAVRAAPGYNAYYWGTNDGRGVGFGDVIVPLTDTFQYNNRITE